MRITVIGTGYVGLVSGACFSEFGHTVTCIDNNKEKINKLQQGIIPIYEPGLDELVKSNCEANRIIFTTDLTESIKGAEVIFIAVGTPSRRGNGHADLSFVYEAVENVGNSLIDYAVVVTKSTVPVGTGRKIGKILAGAHPDKEFDIASNPEFLREGSAIRDFMRPDRVVVGTESERARTIMKALYRPLSLTETPILFTSIETAELIKYASNSFLAMRIAFINEMANLCEVVGADVQDLSKGMGLDNRIGSKFLNAGPGFGGSCFPKDCLALVETSHEAGVDLTVIKAAIRSNETRKYEMARRIIDLCNGVEGKTIAVLGLTFKPETDDMRESPSIVIVSQLISAGANIRAYDPKGMKEAETYFPNIMYCSDSYEAMTDADAVVIITEWNEFRALDLKKVKTLLRRPLVIDLRNIYPLSEIVDGLEYQSIGRN